MVTLLRCGKFEVVGKEVATRDGRMVRREFVAHPGAVVILPVRDDGTILMIRCFRHALDAELLELPAGTLDKPGEEPIVAAARELEEETGHVAASLRPLGDFFPSPGVMNERIGAFLASGLRPTRQQLDETEQIRVEPMSADEALARIDSGEIRDGKTLITLLRWDRGEADAMSWEDRDYASSPYGSGGSRFADNPMAWSLRLGQLWRIDIRVHFTFFVHIFTELLTAGTATGFVARWLAILFGIVFLHELGHCFAARRVGGSANQVLMWPLGGLAYVEAPRVAAAQFLTAAGGPLVNVLFCLLTAPMLVLAAGTIEGVPFNPLNLTPAFSFVKAPWHYWTLLVYWVSYSLLLFNLIPMYPLDGGRMLQAALWGKLGYVRATDLATTTGMIGAICLGIFGLARGNFMFVAIAIFGYFECFKERQTLAAFGRSEYGGEFESFAPRERVPRRRGGPIAWYRQWRERVRLRKLAQARRMEEQLEAEVDRILNKVHEQGMQSLTRAERRTLQVATEKRQAQQYQRGGPAR